LFYDVIAPEVGRYRVIYGERGSFDMMLGTAAIPDRREISYYEPGSEFAIRVGREKDGQFHSLLSGPSFARYEVDFFPLLNEAGITSAEYIHWIDEGLTDKGKQVAQQSATEALRNLEEKEFALSTNRWLNNKVVQNLHYDACLSAALSLPMSVDGHASLIVERSNEVAGAHLGREPNSVFQQSWLSLGLPDPGRETWDVVLTARESRAGEDLRRIISHLSDFAADVLIGGGSADDFSDEANKLLVGELVSELLKRRSSERQVAINVGLNLIGLPGTIIGSGNDIRNVVKENHSWVALLDRLGHGDFRPL
jgi:hypothetical protein